jgi:transcription initiation factor TFIIB
MKTKLGNQLEEITVCPECKSSKLSKDTYRAEIVCKNCGLVIDEDLLDYGPDWRAFDAEQKEKRAHTGAPITPLLSDKGLTTMISWKDKDSYGRTIPNKNRAQVFRLRKWQKRIRIGKNIQRNLSQALNVLNRIASSMTLPRNVRETAAVIYRKVLDEDLIRGRSIQAVAASTIYATCRQYGIPRSLDEIAESSGVSRKEIGRNYLFIARELKFKLQTPSPKDYISRFNNELKLSMETQAKALEITKAAEEKKILSGRAPLGIAAAALYMASVLCGEHKTQKQIADVASVTEVTIRNRYKELATKLNIEFTV